MYGINALKNRKLDDFGKGHWRIYILVFFVFLGALIILFRLYALQVTAYPTYRHIAQNQRSFFQELIPRRGEVYLQEKNEGLYPLAVNRQMRMAYAVPKEIKEKDKAIDSLASILSLEKEFVAAKLSDPEDMFEILKRKLTDEETAKIKEAGIAGIYLLPESFRYYPAGELAAQVAGFVGSDGKEYKGRYGIEAYWEEELKGKAGSLTQEGDVKGRWISIADRIVKPAEDGVDLVLTIDHTVQYEVEKILKKAIEKYGADSGNIVVMDPSTGKMLAVANYPGFNPNEYSKTEDMSLFMNSAVRIPYESGSVFKTITAAIGIDDGKIEPETVYVDTGSVYEAGYEIKNSDGKAYGKQTMTQVLENSLNTGAIYIEKLVGNQKFADYVRRFGFGEKTGIDLPGESAGNIENFKEKRININFFTASFGQGITVTPIQLANAYSAIANGGKLMKPRIVDKIIYPDGKTEEIRPEEIRRVIKEETAGKVGEMLRSVVVNGHGKRADVPGYLVGGKTGTAQVAKIGEKGYEEEVTVGSFAGYAPIGDPKFVVVVKIDNPKGIQWAESTAAPAFKEVMEFLLEYYNIKPTEEYEAGEINN